MKFRDYHHVKACVLFSLISGVCADFVVGDFKYMVAALITVESIVFDLDGVVWVPAARWIRSQGFLL